MNEPKLVQQMMWFCVTAHTDSGPTSCWGALESVLGSLTLQFSISLFHSMKSCFVISQNWKVWKVGSLRLMSFGILDHHMTSSMSIAHLSLSKLAVDGQRHPPWLVIASLVDSWWQQQNFLQNFSDILNSHSNGLWNDYLFFHGPRPVPFAIGGMGQFFGCVKTIVISDRFGMFVDDLQRLWVDKGAVSFWAGKWKRPAMISLRFLCKWKRGKPHVCDILSSRATLHAHHSLEGWVSSLDVWKRLWLAIALECSLMICNACEWTKALSHSGLGSGNGQQYIYIHIHVYVYNQLLECTSLMNKSINHMY